MKDNNSFRKYLLYMLCSAAVVAAATFYFKITDVRKNTRTIVIKNRGESSVIQYTEKPTEPHTSITTHTTTAKIITTQTTCTIAEEFIYLDINSAGINELIKLKGIGEVIANEIILYREKNGGFKNIEEIMEVKGIGEAIFAEIRPHIYVIDPIYPIEEDADETQEYTEEEVPAETEYIPTLEEIAPIDINSADKEVLLMLPHVNDDIADRIIEFRERTGSFSSGYELLLIEGLSRNDIGEIMAYIKIE